MSLETFNTIVGVIGLILAIWAMVSAKSAKQLASEARNAVMARMNIQEDLDRIARVQAVLEAAKDVALRRQSANPAFAAAGRKLTDDVQTLLVAQDQLRTALPVTLPDEIRSEAIAVAAELAIATGVIGGAAGGRNGWMDALGALQLFIPVLETERRQIQDRSVLVEG
jgi:hypothetical protein